MAAIAAANSFLEKNNSVRSLTKVSSSFFSCFGFLGVFIVIFEQCKVGCFLRGRAVTQVLSHPCIPGVQNSALSRDRDPTLPLLVPQANPTPSHLPSTLQDLLLAPDACWTSPHWRRGFRSFMLTASPAIPQGRMTRGSDVSSGSVRPPV